MGFSNHDAFFRSPDLADRTIKLETGNRKTNFRPLTIAVAVATVLVLIRLALPTPPERIRTSNVSDAELLDFIKSSVIQGTTAQGDSARIALGKLLFHDNDFVPYTAGRSGRNESCAGCHDEGAESAKFLTSDRSAPALALTKFYTHFGFSGRTRDLKSFISSHVEGKSELGLTRVRVVRMMYGKYREVYEQAFGSLPPIEQSALPEDGTPSLDMREFPVPVSSFVLETLSDRDQLESLLTQAQAEHLAPAVIVSRAIFLPRLPDAAATENFYKLPADTQEQINLIFANVVSSFSAYIHSLKLPETAYDRFAVKASATGDLQKAQSPEFGTEELTRLRLFFGAAGCARCHHGPVFSDNGFYNIGLPRSDRPDPGHATGLALADYQEACVLTAALPPSPFPGLPLCPTDAEKVQTMIRAVGAFRTAALRGISPRRALTHNGQVQSIEEMLSFYSQLDDRPAVGHRNDLLTPLHLTREEKAVLAAFLKTL